MSNKEDYHVVPPDKKQTGKSTVFSSVIRRTLNIIAGTLAAALVVATIILIAALLTAATAVAYYVIAATLALLTPTHFALRLMRRRGFVYRNKEGEFIATINADSFRKIN